MGKAYLIGRGGQSGVTSWNDLENKPFYEYEEVVTEELTIEFDGVIGDKEFVALNLGGPLTGAGMVRVSDAVLPIDGAAGKYAFCWVGDEPSFTDVESASLEYYNGATAYSYLFVSIPEDNMTIVSGTLAFNGVTFPKRGFYVHCLPDVSYVSSYIGVFTTTKAEFKQLDEKYIPDTIARVSDIEAAKQEAIEEVKTEATNQDIVVLAEARTYAEQKAAEAVNVHNAAADAHNDIRNLLSGLTTRLNALADSDDTTLDQLSEIIAYIKSNKDLIDAITTSKVSVADIVDNLTTDDATKPLSAAQGVAIKGLLDNTVTKVEGKDLSSNDYTDVDKAKLLSIKAGAEPNVQADWNQTDDTQDDFIKNKPDIRPLPEVTADDNDKALVVEEGAWVVKKVESGISSWNDLEDKPFGEVVGVSNTLTWDGTPCETQIILSEAITLNLVSDQTPLLDELYDSVLYFGYLADNGFSDGYITIAEANSVVIDANAYCIMDAMNGVPALAVSKADNITVLFNGIEVFIPKKGIYLLRYEGRSFIKKIETVNYEFTTTEIKTIDAKYLPEIDALPEITEADNGKVLTAENGEWVAKAVSTGESGGVTSWNDLTDKPFSEETIISDTLVIDYSKLDTKIHIPDWDWDDGGIIRQSYWCLISELVPTNEEFAVATYEVCDYGTMLDDPFGFTNAGVVKEGYIVYSDFIIAETDNVALDENSGNVVLPKKGIYAYYDPTWYAASLTLPGYEFATIVVNKLDAKYLPEHSWNNLEDKPFGETVVEGEPIEIDYSQLDTKVHISKLDLTGSDGNIHQTYLYLISERVPSYEEFILGTYEWADNGEIIQEKISELATIQKDDYIIHWDFVVAKQDNVTLDEDYGYGSITLPKKGIYAECADDYWMTSITIPTIKVNKIDQKYLPSTGGGTSAGDLIFTLNENGIVTVSTIDD